MLTQTDIAKALGFSQTTVSLALRGHPSIPLKTRERVTTAANDLGYRVDPLLSALMAQRRGSRKVRLRAKIAVLTDRDQAESKEESSYIQGCFLGAKSAALERGYLCEKFRLDNPGMTGRRLTQILQTQNVHGIIVAPLPVSRPPPQIDWSRFAVISLDYSLAAPEIHRVVDDHAFGMERMMTEIAARGYERPGLVLRDSQDVRTHHSRLGTFLALRQLNPRWTEIKPLILPGDLWSEVEFSRWIKAEHPDIVLTEEWTVPASVERLGFKVPRDLGLAFFHKEHPKPEITGLQVDFKHVGMIAAQVIMRLIETNERGPASVSTTTLVKAFQWNPGKTVRPLGEA